MGHTWRTCALLGCMAMAATAQTYTNPVIDVDAPDPAVLRDGSTYHVYVTGYYHYSSSDLVSWSSRRGGQP